jgi:hypothetical protein
MHRLCVHCDTSVALVSDASQYINGPHLHLLCMPCRHECSTELRHITPNPVNYQTPVWSFMKDAIPGSVVSPVSLLPPLLWPTGAFGAIVRTCLALAAAYWIIIKRGNRCQYSSRTAHVMHHQQSSAPRCLPLAVAYRRACLRRGDRPPAYPFVASAHV